MEKLSNQTIDLALYQSPDISLWQGRPSAPELGIQYWHQAIETSSLLEWKGKKGDIALLGYACDEGVKRNLGRTGAAKAPETIKKQLAKLAWHHDQKVYDLGAIRTDDQLEQAQENLANAVASILDAGSFPIVIGGGHDIAYGHFRGIIQSKIGSSDKRIGIINLDAHFDLRVMEDRPHSGTPFYQILNEHPEVGYLPVGIQEAANTPQLFDIAEKSCIDYISHQDCHDSNLPSVLERVGEFVDLYDYIYITVDMDGFSSAYAPGVSAPSPMGFTPYFGIQLLKHIFQTEKVVSLDIAETNPDLDIDDQTSRLAARVIDGVTSMTEEYYSK